MNLKSVFRAGALACASLMLAGCTRIGRYHMAIESTASNESIQVDVVGVNEAEYDLWAGYSMDDYWSPGNSFRKNAQDKVVLRFGMGQPRTQSVAIDSAAWDAWEARKCRYVFVLTNAGRFAGAGHQGGDPRRLMLPLETNRWDGKAINIQVRPGGLICVNGPLPE